MSLPKVLSGKRRLHFAALVANGIGQAACAVATALLVKHGFDSLISSRAPLSLAAALAFGGGLIATILLTAWLRWRSQLDGELLGQSYIHAVRMALFAHIARIGAEGSRQMSRGAIVLRFIGDLTALRQWVSLGLARLTVSGLAALLAIGALSFVEPVVAMAVAVAVVVASLLALLIGPRLRVRTRESRRRRGRLAAMLNDRVAHIGVVEAFGQEQRELKRFRRLSRRLRRALVARARVVGLLRALSEASGSFASACALLVGAAQVALGQASPGAVVAAMVVSGLLAPRLQDLGRVYEYWNGAVIAREKQLQLLALEAAGRPLRGSTSGENGGHALRDGPGALKIEGLALGGLFDGLDASIAPGERIAIVGPNGAGKSTLLRILAGIREPDAGSVRLDGQDIASLRWEDLRRAFAIVSPDLPLLRGSLRFNLTYGATDWSPDALNSLISALGLEALVGRLPRGLESRVSESGEGLSSGERARIAMARALMTRARVLLLDEADANLDQDAGPLLERVLRLFGGTVIFVTHDPARAAQADRILHLDRDGLTAIEPGALEPGAPERARDGLRLVT